MIEILEMQEDRTVGINFEGRIEAADIEQVFEKLKTAAEDNGKIKMYAEARDFNLSDITAEAVKKDIKLWLENPGIVPQIEKAVLVTDKAWLKTAFDVECALIPTLEGKNFSFDEKEDALEWLKTDQREPSRMDLTVSEFVQTAALKAAGGFALGLLAADLFGKRQRKNIGWAILFGGIAAGLPLGIKVLNNNRKSLKA